MVSTPTPTPKPSSKVRLNLDKLYRTDTGLPPKPTPPSVGSGSYCMRAVARLENTAGGEYIADFVGYSHDFDITEKVEEACKRHASRVSNSKCSDVKLFFIGAHPKCDGRIEFQKNLFESK